MAARSLPGMTAPSRRIHTLLQPLAKAPAQPQTLAGLEDDLVVARALQLEPANPVEVHDDGPVDADEGPFAEILLELRERAPDDVRRLADVQARVVARGFDPVDV